jgi:hypothetical protein
MLSIPHCLDNRLRNEGKVVSPTHRSKQGDDLSLLLFNLALEYAIRKVQENQVRLRMNGEQQLLAYADDGNMLGGNIGTIKKIQKLDLMLVRRLVWK